MIGRAIGVGGSKARHALARGLIRLGVRPNTLTCLGLILTIVAGCAYALGAGEAFAWEFGIGQGASVWLLLAGLLVLLALICDILDGAVAREADQGTRFGAFLDSTLDRFGDFAVYAGIAVFYAAQPNANVTAVLLCMLAFFGSFMISYTRARAEDLIEACKVGFWQRPERSAAILIATFGYNIPALLLQQALLPMLTAIRRIDYTRRVLAGRRVYDDPRGGPWWMRIRLWRWPRATAPHDLAVAVNIAWLVFARFELDDPIGRCLANLAG